MAIVGLSKEQISILEHTKNRAANGLYCGCSPDMDILVKLGLMEFAGRKEFVPDGYYRITAKGREALERIHKPWLDKKPQKKTTSIKKFLKEHLWTRRK